MKITSLTVHLALSAVAAMMLSCKGKNTSSDKAAVEQTVADTTISVSSIADGKVKDMDSKMFNQRIVNLDKNNRKYLSPVPSVIDCYATWCGPCKQQAPILDELAAEYKGRVAFYRIDVEKEPAFTMDLGVSAMPTLFFVSPGKTTNVVGFHSKEEIKKSIEALLKD